MDGKIDKAFAKYEKGYDSLIGGLLTFAIFLAIGLISLIFLKPWVMVADVIIGLVISLPFILKGMRQIDSGAKLMEPKDHRELSGVKAEELPAAHFMADPLAPGSVTEGTTRELVPKDRN
jgi:hypothetical protein